MNPIEGLYQQIGQEIANNIPGQWEQAEVVFTYRPGMSEIESRYFPMNSKERKRIRAGKKLLKLFLELRNRLIEAGQDKWIQAVYVLKPDGKFDLRFEYEKEGE